MTRLPATEMHHGLRVVLFAFSCLFADIRTHRKARP